MPQFPLVFTDMSRHGVISQDVEQKKEALAAFEVDIWSRESWQNTNSSLVKRNRSDFCQKHLA